MFFFVDIPAPVAFQVILSKKDEKGCDPRKDPQGCADKGAPFRGQGRRFSFEPPPNNPRPQCKNRSCSSSGAIKISLPGVPTLPWCPSDGSIKPPFCRNGSESGGARPTDISKQLSTCVQTVYKYAPKTRTIYTLIDPTGAKHQTNNLRKFCKEFQLDYRCTRRVVSGEVKHHKRWTTANE